jgi:hypothetical protein
LPEAGEIFSREHEGFGVDAGLRAFMEETALPATEVGPVKKARFCTWLLCGGRRRRRSDCIKKTRKPRQPVSADAIARLADKGKDVSHFFKGQGRMVQPIQRVNVDVTASMLEELDKAAQDLNVSRQAVIKTLVRQALDQHYLAQRARRPQPAS